MSTPTMDAVEAQAADLALIGRTPSAADVQAVMRFGYAPPRYMICAGGRPVRFAINRLAARVAARSAGRLHPAETIEVEYRPTGERVKADPDGFFVQSGYHWVERNDDDD